MASDWSSDMTAGVKEENVTLGGKLAAKNSTAPPGNAVPVSHSSSCRETRSTNREPRPMMSERPVAMKWYSLVQSPQTGDGGTDLKGL